jgi:hypothetical protein
MTHNSISPKPSPYSSIFYKNQSSTININLNPQQIFTNHLSLNNPSKPDLNSLKTPFNNFIHLPIYKHKIRFGFTSFQHSTQIYFHNYIIIFNIGITNITLKLTPKSIAILTKRRPTSSNPRGPNQASKTTKIQHQPRISSTQINNNSKIQIQNLF